MKHHYPDVFAASLLNALPMGFYSAATIIDDAKRHGVEVRPIDVVRSVRDCTLEPVDDGDRTTTFERSRRFALRVGMRFLKGIRVDAIRRVLEARDARLFTSIEDFADRSRLDERTLASLAESGALASLEPGRRRALWGAKGLAQTSPPELPIVGTEKLPDFVELDEIESVSWDYATAGLSSRAHPLEPLREEFDALGFRPAATINALPDGSAVRYVGIVICRQRPGTASGVVFMTLEDETGFVNLVIWSRIFEQNAILVKTSHLLGVRGKLQVRDGVAHLIAESFFAPRISRAPGRIGSRDFH
jgi:error-prone DNA polymerase